MKTVTETLVREPGPRVDDRQPPVLFPIREQRGGDRFGVLRIPASKLARLGHPDDRRRDRVPPAEGKQVFEGADGYWPEPAAGECIAVMALHQSHDGGALFGVVGPLLFGPPAAA